MTYDLRKIDALVAEHVMGKKLRADGLFDYSVEQNSKSHHSEPMPYSSDFAAAWEALEAFESWSMKYDPDEKLVTVCLMYDESRHYDQAATAPLAICLAALKTKGIEP